MMVVLAVLETSLSFGVLRRAAVASPGAANWTTSVAVWTGPTATSTSPLLSLSVALEIDYFSI